MAFVKGNVDGTIHFVHKYLKPVHEFLKHTTQGGWGHWHTVSAGDKDTKTAG